MKAMIKRVVGSVAIQIASRFPRAKPLLSPAGLRCSQGLFGHRIVPISGNDVKRLRLTNLDQSYLGFQLFWRGLNYYEPITRLLLSRLLTPGSVFLDIGAHHGFFSLTSGLLSEAIRIVAFEPNPANYGLLQANVVANGLMNVHCEPLAISDANGTADLHLTESDMSASLKKGFQSHDTKQIATVVVQTTTLDHYMRKQQNSAPLVIKVDIEGHEAAFMRGAAQTIRKDRPDIVLEVVEDQDPRWVSELKALGYGFYAITDGGLIELEAPRLMKRYPFLFLNHLLTTRPREAVAALFQEIELQVRAIDLLDTSKHFRKEDWPLLWSEAQITSETTTALGTGFLEAERHETR